MGVAAELQSGEDDHHHMSTSNIWRRSASFKGAAESNYCDIGHKKKASGSANKTGDHGDSSKKKKQLCLCAPTTHPGSFKCRLHRVTGTTNSAPVHKPLASSSMKCSPTGKKSFSSRNMALAPTGNLDGHPEPRLSRFAAAAVNASGSRTNSTALQKNEQVYEPYQDAAE